MAKDIFDYVIEGNLPEVQAWLNDEKKDIDEDNNEGDTPLHLAVKNGYTEIVKLLLEQGAAVIAYNNDNNTPLHFAVLNGHTEIVKLLLDNDADNDTYIDEDNNEGDTPLHLAALNGHTEIVKLLLGYQADVNVQNTTLDTPLHLAVNNDKKEIVQLLLEKKPNIHIECNNGTTAYEDAIEKDDLEIIQLFLKARHFVVNQYEETIVHKAASICNTNILKNQNFSYMMKYEKDENGASPIHFAVYNAQSVQLLLECGVDVNARDNDGNTPLHLASERRSNGIDAIELLLENGANIDEKNNEGDTPLHLAVKNGYTEIVKLLLEHGANSEGFVEEYPKYADLVDQVCGGGKALKAAVPEPTSSSLSSASSASSSSSNKRKRENEEEDSNKKSKLENEDDSVAEDLFASNATNPAADDKTEMAGDNIEDLD